MPRQFIPRQSGPHRIACIALYRALLEQCPRIPLPLGLPSRGPVNPIKHMIRKRFRKHIADTSPRIIVEALKQGYNAEELLRTAGDRDEFALSQVHKLLLLNSQRIDAARQMSPPRLPPKRASPRVAPLPGAPKLLDVRPLPLKKLSGRRHVPILAHASGYAFLRVKKPSSPFLDRVLMDKIKQKEKRFNKLAELALGIELAKDEQQWEKIVAEKLAEEGGGNNEWLESKGKNWGLARGLGSGGWHDASAMATSQIYQHLERDLTRSKEQGERMIELVKKERALWEKERDERKKSMDDAKQKESALSIAAQERKPET